MERLYRFETDQSEADSRRYASTKGDWGLILLRILIRRGWFCLIPLGGCCLVYFRVVSATIILTLFFGVLLVIVVYLILSIYSRITHELDRVPTIKSIPCYQDRQMLELVWSQPVARLYRNSIYYQPREGYCGHATINNVLQSIPGCKTWIRLPSTPNSISLNQMMHYWKALADRAPPIDNAIQIKSITAWNAENATFESFLEEMKLLNNPRYRFLCNFLRGPLFFSDPKKPGNILRRLLTGHWSPIVAYLPPTSSSPLSLAASGIRLRKQESADETFHEDKAASVSASNIPSLDEGLILLLDVNSTYGPYLVSARRLFGAVRTRAMTGQWRGLVRIELREL